MELIIKIDEDLYEAYKGKPPMLGDAGMDMIAQAITNGIPYDKVIDEVTELLENEWGYEGMRDDVARIMEGGAK